MTLNLSEKEIELYKLEVCELTELLYTEWLDLKETLSDKINLDNAYLCSYYEGEEGEEYGAVLTKEKEIYEFELFNGEIVHVTQIEDIAYLEKEYPQVIVALNMESVE